MAGNERSGRGGKAAERNPVPVADSAFSLSCPNWLPPLAREYWGQNVPRLIAAGAIQDKDFPALCRLCELYANWRFCQAVIAEKGCTYTTTSDRGAMRIVARPEASLELQYHKEMLNLERKFGLNPVDGKEIKFKKDDAKKSVRDRY